MSLRRDHEDLQDSSDEDSDLEASLLDPDDPHLFGYHDHDSQRGLISPYKRLRVDDEQRSATSISMESQGGEGEAYSLLRSLDGSAADGAHRSVLFSTDDSGGYANRSRISMEEKYRNDVNVSVEIHHPPSHRPQTRHSIGRRGSPVGQCTEICDLNTSSTHNTSVSSSFYGGSIRYIDEVCMDGDPYQSADEREFPGPPKLDRKTPSTTTSIGEAIQQPSCLDQSVIWSHNTNASDSSSQCHNSSSSPDAYHPDYQTLECKNILYYPLELSNSTTQNKKTTQIEDKEETKISTTTVSQHKMPPSPSQTDSNNVTTDIKTRDASPEPLPSGLQREICTIESASQISLPKKFTNESEIKTKKRDISETSSPSSSPEVVDDLRSTNPFSHQIIANTILTASKQNDEETSPTQTAPSPQTLRNYFTERSEVVVDTMQLASRSPSHLQLHPVENTNSEELCGISKSRNDASTSNTDLAPSHHHLNFAPTPAPETDAVTNATSTSRPPSVTAHSSSQFCEDGCGSRIYDSLDSDYYDFGEQGQGQKSLQHQQGTVKTYVSSGVSTSDLNNSSNGYQLHRLPAGGYDPDIHHSSSQTSTDSQDIQPRRLFPERQTNPQPSSTHELHSNDYANLHYFGSLGEKPNSLGVLIQGELSNDRAYLGERMTKHLSTGQVYHSGTSSWFQLNSGHSSQSGQSKTSLDAMDEYMEKASFPSSLAISNRKARKAVLQSSGLLKIAAYMNVGLLTVNIVKAKHLSSAWTSHCDAYIKMSLVPDDSRRTRCKTKLVNSTNNPVFDEKFSIEILEEDKRKRLLVSVWHKDEHNG